MDLNVPAGIQPGEKRVLRKRGAQKLNRRSNDKGDHWVTFEIQIPSKLTEEQKELIRKAFSLPSEKKQDKDNVANPTSKESDVENEAEDKKTGLFGFFKDLKDCATKPSKSNEKETKQASGSG